MKDLEHGGPDADRRIYSRPDVRPSNESSYPDAPGRAVVTVIDEMTRVAGGVRRRARRTRKQIEKRLAGRQVNRYNARNATEAATALVAACRVWSEKHAATDPASRPGTVAVVWQPSSLEQLVRSGLAEAGLPTTWVSATAVRSGDTAGSTGAGLSGAGLTGAACIALAVEGSDEQFALAAQLVADDATAQIPLEYVALPRVENEAIDRWDRLRSVDFVSPLLVEHGATFFDIYAESLGTFRQKTEIRDYLDICQVLVSLRSRGIDGNIAEFGSFQGHSGWLMSRVLETLGSDAELFLFDMFEAFPDEAVGVDGFWSGTHEVSFDAVRSRFEGRDNVTFVQGDFTETLGDTETGPLAFAFIDCDSYRATRALLDQLWDDRLVEGGLVVLEDYGHAALLGNRLAVHEFFDGRSDAYTSFSQFSGMYSALKLPSSVAPTGGAS